MLRCVGFRERSTEKTLTVEPSSSGVRVFLVNHALDEKLHMQLTLNDMKLLVHLLQGRIAEIGKGDDALVELTD